jgi:DNA-binding winged helix-turn-helix (wHTH) protein/tetratricopeptide (TPR) repeat protein
MSQRSHELFVFSGFIFDPNSGELLRNGTRYRISKQTAEILSILLDNAGQLVSREEIRKRLWPNGEIVGYENIINKGVSQLRYTLKEGPNDPNWIERVPKRGYRFIMAVERRQRTSANPPMPEPLQPDLIALPDETTAVPPQISRIRRTALLGACTVLLLVASAGAGYWRWYAKFLPATPVASVPHDVMLAVAPFETSGPGSQELAQSFRLEVLDSLSQLPRVRVRDSHSADQLHPNDTSLRDSASRLGLDVVVFGSFTTEGRKCRMQFEVVQVKNAEHLATLQYSGTIDQLSAIRDRIQRDIFDKLKLTENGSLQPARVTSDPQAYELYLQARYHFLQQSPEALEQAVAEYHAAITRDPEFSNAYAGLASTLVVIGRRNMQVRQQSFDQANDAAARALDLTPNSPEAHSTRGLVYLYRDWNTAAAEREERTATQLDPQQSSYHQWLAIVLCDQGRFPEAFNEIDQAVANDPNWPYLYLVELFVTENAGDSQRMLAAGQKLEELLPNSPMAQDAMANALWYSRHYPQAIEKWQAMAIAEGDPARASMETEGLKAFREQGVSGYAEIRIKAMADKKISARHPNDFEPAEWYMAANRKEQAIAALQEMAAAHQNEFIDFIYSPIFAEIRDTPAFIALLTKYSLRLPEPIKAGAMRTYPDHADDKRALDSQVSTTQGCLESPTAPRRGGGRYMRVGFGVERPLCRDCRAAGGRPGTKRERKFVLLPAARGEFTG